MPPSEVTHGRVGLALGDLQRPGRPPDISAEARAWVVALACRKPQELGYPEELWTTRLLASHARGHGPAEGHPSLAQLARGTVSKILKRHELRPHKVSYYLERRDPEFDRKIADVLFIYKRVVVMRESRGGLDPRLCAINGVRLNFVRCHCNFGTFIELYFMGVLYALTVCSQQLVDGGRSLF